MLLWGNRRPLLNTTEGGTGGGTTTTSSGEGTGTAGGGTAGAGTGNPWFSGFKADDVRGYIEQKGFKDPESLASAYWNLEKTRGVPQERLLTLPADDKPESWGPVYNKLGRPEKPEGYDVKGADGTPADFLAWQRQTFHELGLSKKQGDALSAKWNELVTASAAGDQTAAKEALGQQITKLKQEWGAAAKQNIEVVDAMVEKLGLDEATQKKMEGVLGFDGFAKLLYGMTQKFGIKLGESEFHGSDGGTSADFGAMTPASAKARRDELLSDPTYYKAWSAGDIAKKSEIDRLFKFIYPG